MQFYNNGTLSTLISSSTIQPSLATYSQLCRYKSTNSIAFFQAHIFYILELKVLARSALPPSYLPINPHHCQKDTMSQIIIDVLHNGIIQPSTNLYSSPILLVSKKDGTWRYCVDYRHCARPCPHTNCGWTSWRSDFLQTRSLLRVSPNSISTKGHIQNIFLHRRWPFRVPHHASWPQQRPFYLPSYHEWHILTSYVQVCPHFFYNVLIFSPN